MPIRWTRMVVRGQCGLSAWPAATRGARVYAAPMVTRFSVMMVALVVGSGFGCKDKGKAEPEPGPKASADAAVRVVPPDAPLDAPVNPWAGAGSCKVKVTGAATIDQTDSAAAVQASWWLTDVDRAVFPQADS